MNLISTRVHGLMDYLIGIILILSPWLFGFSEDPAATWVPFVLGCGAIVYSLITDQELGAVRVLPMGAHLAMDLASGVFLLASPWLLGFADRIAWPHVTFGILEIGVAMMTSRVAGHERERGRRRVAM